MPHILNYRFPKFLVAVHEDDHLVRTVFEDDTAVEVRPAAAEDVASALLAYELGYRIDIGGEQVVADKWAMVKDHELTRSWIAIQEGKDWSPTLWAIAHGCSVDDDSVREEEARVLEFQRTLNKGMPRPWAHLFDREPGDLLGISRQGK